MKLPIPTVEPLPPPPSPKGKGSRTSLQKRKAVLVAIETGESLTQAAGAAGVPARTAQDWLHRGAQHEVDGKDTWEVKFLRDHAAALGRYLATCVKDLHDYAKGDWRALAWILERRDPETWGRPVKIEHSGPEGQPLGGIGPPVVVNLIVRRPEGADEETTPFTFADRSEDSVERTLAKNHPERRLAHGKHDIGTRPPRGGKAP